MTSALWLTEDIFNYKKIDYTNVSEYTDIAEDSIAISKSPFLEKCGEESRIGERPEK